MMRDHVGCVDSVPWRSTSVKRCGPRPRAARRSGVLGHEAHRRLGALAEVDERSAVGVERRGLRPPEV